MNITIQTSKTDTMRNQMQLQEDAYIDLEDEDSQFLTEDNTKAKILRSLSHIVS